MRSFGLDSRGSNRRQRHVNAIARQRSCDHNMNKQKRGSFITFFSHISLVKQTSQIQVEIERQKAQIGTASTDYNQKASELCSLKASLQVLQQEMLQGKRFEDVAQSVMRAGWGRKGFPLSCSSEPVNLEFKKPQAQRQVLSKHKDVNDQR